MSQSKAWIDHLEARANRGPMLAPSWLADRRASARSRFLSLAWPSRRAEAWRSFDLTALATMSPAEPTPLSESDVAVLIANAPLPAKALRLVFVDGRFHAKTSSPLSALQAFGIAPLSVQLGQDDAFASAFCGQEAPFDDHPITALNMSLFEDGLCIDLPAGVAMDRPLAVLRIQSAHTRGALTALRHLIRIGEGASLQLIEWDLGQGSEEALSTQVLEVQLEAGARFDRLRIQDAPEKAWSFSEARIRQAGQSRASSHYLGIGAAASRDELSFRLTAEQAHCRFDGLYLLAGDQRADHVTSVTHEAPHCTSDEAYKGVLDGRSLGAFTGRIIVAEDAQKTDAYQNNKNLLLSDEAQIHTRPQLEIYADDVKCSHGATIGQIDETQLFYLMSRGLPAESARGLLIQAFARELLERVDEPILKDLMAEALERRFRAKEPETSRL